MTARHFCFWHLRDLTDRPRIVGFHVKADSSGTAGMPLGR
jgi:hypothetical protein